MEEKIVLQSFDYSPTELVPVEEERRNIQCKIHCHGPSNKIRLTHKVFDNKFIESERFHKKSEERKKVSYHLGFLNPEPEHAWVFNKALVAISFIMLVAAIICASLQLWLPMLAPLAVLFPLAYGAYLSLNKQTVFRSKAGHAPLVFISYKKRNPKSIKTFISQLSERIERSRLSEAVNPLPEETKLLRRFFEAGFFTQGEYEIYRDAVFQKYPKRQ